MSEISSAIRQICEEKGLSYEAVITTIESALAAAYRKDYGEKNQNIKVEYDPETNTSRVFDVKTVVEDVPEEELMAMEEETESKDEAGVKTENKEVASSKDKKSNKETTEEVTDKESTAKETKPENSESEEEVVEEKKRFNPKNDIQISEAKELDAKYEIGDEIKTELETHDEYGRMAAQTAKQVIIQRLREAERDMIFNEFKDKENEVITGFIQRREGRLVLVDLGKATGIVPPEDQIRTERYNTGERMKFYLREVRVSHRGPEIILSRTSDEILKRVFYFEIPEISNGLVEIKSVAREAGSRSKVAVLAENENIDPIGSCVGQRGSRIQTIIRELGGEKIDIIEYSDDPETFISNALSPAKVEDVKLVPEQKQVYITVKDDQLSLAIGKEGQNVRLASALTGWKIDIAGDGSNPNLAAEADVKKTEDETQDDNQEENELTSEVSAEDTSDTKDIESAENAENDGIIEETEEVVEVEEENENNEDSEEDNDEQTTDEEAK